MRIFPAIDLRGGRVVRLSEGRFESEHVYATEPLTAAMGFKATGAAHLHVVDLDGAKDAKPRSFEVIKEIAEATKLFVEVGGGIRNMATIHDYLRCGVSRCILGTAAVNDEPFLREALREFGERIAVGVDAKDGFVAVSAWAEKTSIDGVGFCKRLRELGAACVIYTDISKDGMLAGPNIGVYKELKRIDGLEVVASGGVTTIGDVAALKAAGADGAIIGKALYEGKLTLKDALSLC